MRPAPRNELDRDVKLQRHPDLVRSIACPDSVFPAGRPKDAVRLSPDALEILDAFARPRRIRDVVPDADGQVLGALSEWVGRGLLMRASRPIPASSSLPLEAHLWVDAAPRMRRRVSKLVPARREKLRGLGLAVVDGVFTEEEVQAASECFQQSPFARIVTKGHARDVYDLTARVPFVECVTAVVERVFPRLDLELYWVYCNRMRYGDVAFAHSDAQKPSLTALYYANARWEDDWAGETLFYGAPDETIAVVAPRPGRLTIFDGQIVHRGGVPSRLCHEARLTLVVKYWIRGAAR